MKGELLNALGVLMLASHRWFAAAADFGKIMPLGDSITDGHGTGGYRGRLACSLAAAGHTFTFVGSQWSAEGYHEGHPGYQIAGIQGGIGSWVPAAQPDYILLMIGTNDLSYGNGYNIPLMLEKLDILVADLLRLTTDSPYPGHRVKLIVASVPPIDFPVLNAQAGQYGAGISDLARTHRALGEQVMFLDLHSELIIPDDLGDAVHPNAAGYAKMAAAWFDALAATVEPRSFSSWRQMHGLAEDGSQDGEVSLHHGVSNLLAFALNTAPDAGDLARPAAPLVIEPEGSRGLPRHWQGDGEFFYQFSRRRAGTGSGIRYLAERTTHLDGTWSEPPGEPTITPIDNVWERVTYRDLISDEGYYRLRVVAE